jgi:hypothetical protein
MTVDRVTVEVLNVRRSVTNYIALKTAEYSMDHRPCDRPWSNGYRQKPASRGEGAVSDDPVLTLAMLNRQEIRFSASFAELSA